MPKKNTGSKISAKPPRPTFISRRRESCDEAMSFSFSQALISETCPFTQPLGSDGHSQVLYILLISWGYLMLKQLDRTTRGRVSSHKSTSARSCTTRAARGQADLLVKTLQDNAQYQDGPQQACNKSLSAFLTLHRKLVGQVQMWGEPCLDIPTASRSRSVFSQTRRNWIGQSH